jgi:16S rRNA (adenine1518-N6/adenine1519-N6)-dimethyltransferase
VRARKRFGQHFLEPAWITKVVEAIAPQPDDFFVEIGPGTGALTRPIASRARRVVGIEIDRDLAARLAAAVPPNVEIITGDFLEVDVGAALARALGEPGAGPLGEAPEGQPSVSPAAARVRVAGNLPYNVASPILFKLLDLHARQGLFADAALMLQREVADRLLARPGTKEYGVLGILVGLRAKVTPLLMLPPGAFRPVPKVSSAVVRVTFQPVPADVDSRVFERVVRGLFQRRRKTLLNGLRAIWPAGSPMSPAEGLAKAVLDPRRRPETLDLTELARLAASYASAAGPDVV